MWDSSRSRADAWFYYLYNEDINLCPFVLTGLPELVLCKALKAE